MFIILVPFLLLEFPDEFFCLILGLNVRERELYSIAPRALIDGAILSFAHAHSCDTRCDNNALDFVLVSCLDHIFSAVDCRFVLK